MNELIAGNSQHTMSSLEIATLTGTQHKHVLENVREVLSECGIEPAGFSASYKAGNGQYQPCFNLPRRECDLIIAGYSAKYRLAIIDRWQELEATQQFQLPQTFSAALKLAGELQEQVEKLQVAAIENAPKVEFAMAVRRMEGACKIGDFGKVIGIGRNSLFAMLRKDSILMADRMPYQKYIDHGWFVVVEQVPYTDSQGKSHPAFTTMVTGKGQVALERKYRVPKTQEVS